MRDLRGRAKATIVALVATLALLALGVGPVAARDTARVQHDRILAHWTAARIARATPRDVIRVGRTFRVAPKAGLARPSKPGSSAILGASWTSGGPLLARTGRVVFTMGGSDWICSGSVVDDGNRPGYSMVLTAGHCAIDETTGAFATNWMFIPSFDTAPTYTCSASAYGCWTATALVVRNELATAGSFNDKAVTNDWALAVVGPGGKSGNAQLDATVGSYPMGFSGVAKGDRQYAVGYPASGKYHGNDLVYCAGAITEDAQIANLTWGMACTMTGGSSGGPWLSGFDESTGLGTLSSVSSYGYSGQSVMYGPKFNSRTQATYTAARTATVNTRVWAGIVRSGRTGLGA
jgi:hypothetical protein